MAIYSGAFVYIGRMWEKFAPLYQLKTQKECNKPELIKKNVGIVILRLNNYSLFNRKLMANVITNLENLH